MTHESKLKRHGSERRALGYFCRRGDVIGALALLDRRAPGGGAPENFAERDALTLASVVVPVGLVLGALAPANAERDSTVEAYAGHALERGR